MAKQRHYCATYIMKAICLHRCVTSYTGWCRNSQNIFFVDMAFSAVKISDGRDKM